MCFSTPNKNRKIAESGTIDIVNRNRAMVGPFSDIVDEALLHYSQTVFSNTEDV